MLKWFQVECVYTLWLVDFPDYSFAFSTLLPPLYGLSYHSFVSGSMAPH